MAIVSDSTEAVSSKSRSSIWQDKLLPALLIIFLATSLLFVTGFAETSVLHNAAHDGRHSASFPCH
jgi:cobalt transporter subunit CbtB